jgi:hypothetical protein
MHWRFDISAAISTLRGRAGLDPSFLKELIQRHRPTNLCFDEGVPDKDRHWVFIFGKARESVELSALTASCRSAAGLRGIHAFVALLRGNLEGDRHVEEKALLSSTCVE